MISRFLAYRPELMEIKNLGRRSRFIYIGFRFIYIGVDLFTYSLCRLLYVGGLTSACPTSQPNNVLWV